MHYPSERSIKENNAVFLDKVTVYDLTETRSTMQDTVGYVRLRL
jgi:hypothetical protein